MKPLKIKCNHFRWLSRSAKAGSAFASIEVIVVCLSLGGCLILDRHEASEEPNYPPSIVSAANAEHPLGEIVRLNSESEIENENFAVIVRDANVEQQLEYRVYLDRIPSLPDNQFVYAKSLEPVGTVERPLDFDLSRGRLTGKPCTKVELIVVGEWSDEGTAPVVEGDIAIAVWWVTSVETLNLADCAQ